MPEWRFHPSILAAILLCCLIGTGKAEAADRTVILSFAESNAPYAWVSNGQVQGLELDIITTALALAGYRLEAAPRPYRRLAKVLEAERIDGITGQRLDELPGYYYSDPYMHYDNYAIVRQDSGLALRSVGDLLAHNVVAWRGAAESLGLSRLEPDRFAAANEKSYLEFADQPMTFRYFWNHRADVLVSDKYIYETYLREHPDSAKNIPPVTYLRIFPEHQVRVAFKSREVRDAFDQGFRAFQEGGGYQRLLDRYFSPQPASLSRSN